MTFFMISILVFCLWLYLKSENKKKEALRRQQIVSDFVINLNYSFGEDLGAVIATLIHEITPEDRVDVIFFEIAKLNAAYALDIKFGKREVFKFLLDIENLYKCKMLQPWQRVVYEKYWNHVCDNIVEAMIDDKDEEAS